MRTLGSFNHTGLDEEPIAISLRRTAQCASMGYDPTIGGPAWEAFPGRAVPCGTQASYYGALIQGWVEFLRNPSSFGQPNSVLRDAATSSHGFRIAREDGRKRPCELYPSHKAAFFSSVSAKPGLLTWIRLQSACCVSSAISRTNGCLIVT